MAKQDIFTSIGDWDTATFVFWHNAMCRSYDRQKDTIFKMDEIDLILDGYKPSRIAQMISDGNFDAVDKYFWFDEFHNLFSGSYFDKHNAERNKEITGYIWKIDKDAVADFFAILIGKDE